jgi:hypothetical protein
VFYAHEVQPYRFSNTWRFPVSTETLFKAVTDLANYPLWWPNILSVRQLDEDVAELVCRALLPYKLVIQMRRQVQDERAGRLRVELSGDLEGFLTGSIAPNNGGAQLLITQEVIVSKKALRRMNFIARPLFRVNHTAMMRQGYKHFGLYLASQ